MATLLFLHWAAVVSLAVMVLWFASYLRTKGFKEPFECVQIMAKKDSSARAVGSIFLLTAVLLGYVVVYWTYVQATEQSRYITYFNAGVAVTCLAAIMGVTFLVLGARVQRVMPMDYEWRSYSLVQWIFMLLVVIASMGATVGFQKLLESMGYHRLF